ncbi:MAG: TVP38/TMEM64 family protein [Rhodobacteraceae bacterium]|nr:TVP38/TMEM64 family protein [Paracoccaceae bacterium]
MTKSPAPHPAPSARPRPPADGAGPSWRRHLPITVIAVGAVAGFLLFRDSLSFEALAAHREALVALRDEFFWLASAGFIAAYIGIVVFSLPGALVASLTGGFLFGLFPGVLYNVTAATIGASLLFAAARLGPGAALARRIDASDGAARRLRDGLLRNQIPVLLLMRLVPAVPFFVANLLPALAGVRFGLFAATTFVGIIPGALVYTWIGAGLGEVFARGDRPDLSIMLEWHILGPILGLCALAALPLLLRRRGAAT